MELKGQIQNFALNGHERQYIVCNVPYGLARKTFIPDRFSADTGEGEQREVYLPHAKKIRLAMLNGKYTPTSIAVGIRQQDRPTKLKTENSEAIISLSDEDTLPLLDAGHRFEALKLIHDAADEKLKAQVDSLPITTLVYLDGDTKQDFLNLQLGRTVDRAHTLSLNVQTQQVKQKDAPHYTFAMQTAKILNQTANSPFSRQIRFDSRGGSGLPISTLMSKGGSDLGTSLLGGAKIAVLAGRGNDPEWLADIIIQTFEALQKDAPHLLALGKVLCPPPDGKKGAATMIVAVGNMMAYRVHAKKRDLPNDEDIKMLIAAADKTMDESVDGNFSGPKKRSILGDFAYNFFADLEEQEHEGVPIGLLNVLSASTFAVTRPKKEKAAPKKRGRKKKTETTEAEINPASSSETDEPEWKPVTVPIVADDTPEFAEDEEELVDTKESTDTNVPWEEGENTKEEVPWEEEVQG